MNLPEDDWLDILTNKTFIEDTHMKAVNQEIEKMKPHLTATFFLNSVYISGISEVLIARGIMTEEEDKLLRKTALEEAERLVEEHIKKAREAAKAEFSKVMNQKEN